MIIVEMTIKNWLKPCIFIAVNQKYSHMKFISRHLLSLSAALSAAIVMHAQPAFTDRSLSPRQRAEDLVGRLTLEEKVTLMMYNSPAVERLGIRTYNWWNEALHGVARNGNATVFPMPVGMAASFDNELLNQVFTAASDEGRIKWNIARAAGDEDMWYKGLSFWTPNINIFRDPRWGRGMETYGEDPYLTGQLGMEVVRGLQGERGDGTMKAMACAKHFAVHSGPEWSRHSFDAVVSERDLWETYLPAFKDLVVKADVDQVMFSYNRIFGEPAGANKRFMRDILEDEWGFDGIVVSDCWAVTDFHQGHKWVATRAEAAAAALKAGMDLECGESLRALPEAVEKGLVSEQEIDEAVTRLMTIRYMLGEMDGESPWDAVPYEKLCSREHASLALEMARASMVLLENDGVLPLRKGQKVVLMGPNAADSTMMWGNYNGFPLKTVTLLEAMKTKDPDIGYVPDVPYVAGLRRENSFSEAVSSKAIYDPSATKVDISRFVKAAGDCDIVVFAGGISPCLEGEEMPVNAPGFRGGDRVSIELPEVQRQLVKALRDAGKKVVFVNFSGSAVALAEESRNCDAILQAWYPGQEGGTAVADVLYGDSNPSGKLPLTFYASDSQLVDYENYDMEGRTYRYFRDEPLYPFGHGLSYTSFGFGEGRVLRKMDGSLEFVVPVENTGSCAGGNVVQLYVSRPDDAEGPVKTLRGYTRIYLEPGQSTLARIPIDEETFLWWNPASGRMDPLPGEYLLHYGDSSAGSALQTVPCQF